MSNHPVDPESTPRRPDTDPESRPAAQVDTPNYDATTGDPAAQPVEPGYDPDSGYPVTGPDETARRAATGPAGGHPGAVPEPATDAGFDPDRSYEPLATDTRSVAKEEAGALAEQARAEGSRVAGEAKAQAGQVAAEAKAQVRSLAGQARHTLTDQAGQQQQRAGAGLRGLSDELYALADGRPGSGLAHDLVQDAADRLGGVARWLETREPQGLLDDVRRYARRNPVTFLALCAGAGLLAGRVTRSLKDSPEFGSGPSHGTGSLPAGANPTNTPGFGGPSAVEQGVLATPSGQLPPVSGQGSAAPGPPSSGTPSVPPSGGTSSGPPPQGNPPAAPLSGPTGATWTGDHR